MVCGAFFTSTEVVEHLAEDVVNEIEQGIPLKIDYIIPEYLRYLKQFGVKEKKIKKYFNIITNKEWIFPGEFNKEEFITKAKDPTNIERLLKPTLTDKIKEYITQTNKFLKEQIETYVGKYFFKKGIVEYVGILFTKTAKKSEL